MPRLISRLRFRLSTVFWLIACVAILSAWHRDHQRLTDAISTLRPRISSFGEKHYLWCPSAHLACGTAEVEARLAGRIGAFGGEMVQSSQGISDAQLRVPDMATLDAVIALLEEPHDVTRRDAVQLIALFLEACSGQRARHAESFAIKIRFDALGGVNSLLRLLHDPNKEIRQAAALAIGNTLPSRRAVESLRVAFDDETDFECRIYQAWAYYTLTTLPF